MMEDRDFFKLLVASAISSGATPSEAIEVAELAMFLEKAYWAGDER